MDDGGSLGHPPPINLVAVAVGSGHGSGHFVGQWVLVTVGVDVGQPVVVKHGSYEVVYVVAVEVAGAH